MINAYAMSIYHESGVPAGFFLPQKKGRTANNGTAFLLFLIYNVQSCNMLILYFNPVYGFLGFVILKTKRVRLVYSSPTGDRTRCNYPKPQPRQPGLIFERAPG